MPFIHRPSPRTSDLLLFLASVGALVIAGLIFIYAASSALALQQHSVAHYYAWRQACGLVAAIVAAFCVGLCPFERITHLSAVFFWIAIIINLIPVCIPSYATTMHGSARWIALGAFSFQPSELLKIAAILRAAVLMSRPAFGMSTSFTQLADVGIVLLASLCTLLLQPDFGQSLLITLTCGYLLFVSHRYLGYFRILVLPAILGALALVVLAPYRMRRIFAFLNPWNDPQGAGFQAIQSFIAIGAGGLLGRGIGNSQQKFFYLPMQHTDFIFAIIAEETGLLGCLVMISLYLTFLWSGLKLAWSCTNYTARLTISGLVVLISLQACMNIAVTTGLAPTKGIGLPFVSYGLSSLIGHGIMVGMILSARRAA